MGNGQMIPGLEMAPKVFVIICDVELGKPYVLPECPGNDLARGNDGPEGRAVTRKSYLELQKCHSFHSERPYCDTHYQ